MKNWTARFGSGLQGFSTIAAIFLMFALLGRPAVAATAPKKPAGPPVPTLRTNNLAPLPAGEKAAISHSAFEDGDCSICHKNKHPKHPSSHPADGPDNK